jgi:hypothetical protein
VLLARGIKEFPKRESLSGHPEHKTSTEPPSVTGSSQRDRLRASRHRVFQAERGTSCTSSFGRKRHTDCALSTRRQRRWRYRTSRRLREVLRVGGRSTRAGMRCWGCARRPSLPDPAAHARSSSRSSFDFEQSRTSRISSNALPARG